MVFRDFYYFCNRNTKHQNKMKKLAITLLCALAFAACTNNQPDDNQNNQTNTNMENTAKVYLTRNISPEALVNIYKALGVEAKGRWP